MLAGHVGGPSPKAARPFTSSAWKRIRRCARPLTTPRLNSASTTGSSKESELKEAQDRVSEAEKESSNLKGRVQELEKQLKATQAAGISGTSSSSTSH